MKPRDRTVAKGVFARSLIVRVSFLGILLWGFVEGEVTDWIASGLAVVTAALASYPMIPAGSWRWRLVGLIRFVPFFFWQSLRGAIDVAARALAPRLPISPGFLDYPLRLPEGPARVFFVNTLSLLPGTLSAHLTGDTLRVHQLNRDATDREQIARFEDRVAELFGV